MAQKILMLIPNLDFGGAQRVFHDQAKILATKYEVIECSFNLEGGQAYPSGNKMVTLGVPAGSNALDKAFRFLQRCWKLYLIKKKDKPLITISHLEGADYVNILSFGFGKKVLVVHGSKVHDQEIDSSFGWLRRKMLLPFLYKQADLIITVSGGIKNELVDIFKIPPGKIIIIYNFFEAETLKDCAKEPSSLPFELDRKGFKLINSGRFAPQKNQAPLLYIVKCLKEEYQLQVQLFFAGDGPLKQSLKSLAGSLSLQYVELNELNENTSADIVFLGYQQNPFKFYKEMDLFLFPSAWEGFPMALGEAMVLGLPVLASDCPTGPLELLMPEWQHTPSIKKYPVFTPHGILMPVPDIEKVETIRIWSEVVSRVLQDAELRKDMREAAQMRMRLLDKNIIQKRWLEIAENVGR